MGALQKAKKEYEKKKKHPASEASEAQDLPEPSAEEQPDDEQAPGDDSSDQGAPQPDSDQGEQDDQGGGADASEEPSQPQDGGGGDSGSDSDQGSPDQEVQAGGDDSGQQGGAPSDAGRGPSGDTEGGETAPEDTSAGPGSASGTDPTNIPMSPALEEEYNRVHQFVMQQIYGPGPVGQSIVRALHPDQHSKVRTAVGMVQVILKSTFARLHFPLQLVMPITKDIAAHVMDIGQQVKQIQYSDQEATSIVLCSLESVIKMFGVNHGQGRKLAHLLGRSVVQQHAGKYQQAVQFAKGAHAPQPAPGGPQQAGPQSGAPPGAQAQPTSGNPPTPPPPPGGAPPEAPEPDQGGGQQ